MFVRNRLSPLVGTSIQALEGRDRFGHKQSLARLAEELARKNAPIPLQPWTQESDDPFAKLALRTLLKMVGVNEKQALSGAMEKAQKLRQEHSGDHERTPEQCEHWRLIRQAIDDYHKSNGQDYSTALKLVKSRKLTDYERRELEAGMRMPPIAFAVRGLPAEDVLKVYEKATDQEKRDLLRYDNEAFERLVKKHMEAAARAEYQGLETTARNEREEANRLVHEFRQMSTTNSQTPVPAH